MTTASTSEEMARRLNACLDQDDGGTAFMAALGDMVRARGIDQVARDAGLSLEALHDFLSCEQAPEFFDLILALRVMGVRLGYSPA